MNKWMKHGVMGLALSAATVSAEQASKKAAAPEKAKISQEVSIDAMDFAGGSKLKDRMKNVGYAQNLELTLVSKMV